MADSQSIEEIEGDVQEVLSDSEQEQDIMYPSEEQMYSAAAEIIRSGLSRIGKTASGESYAFTNLVVRGKGLIDLYGIMQNYRHLRRIDLSDNFLSDVTSLTSIQYLRDLNLSNNRISNMEIVEEADTLQYLEVLNLSKNQIPILGPINLITLRKLILTDNIIASCEDFQGHSQLELLDLRRNQLTTMKGIWDMPRLMELYIAENNISILSELESLPMLQRLHLRKNPIEQIANPAPFLPNLEYLNLRETVLSQLDSIQQLSLYRNLKSLNVMGTPLVDELASNAKKEILMLLQMLQTINKENVEQEEKAEAQQDLAARQEEERKRLEEEQEAKRLAEEEERLRIEQEEKELAEARAAEEQAHMEAELNQMQEEDINVYILNTEDSNIDIQSISNRDDNQDASVNSDDQIHNEDSSIAEQEQSKE